MAEGVLPSTKEGIGAMTKLDHLMPKKGKSLTRSVRCWRANLAAVSLQQYVMKSEITWSLKRSSALKSGKRRLNSELAPTFGLSRLYGDF